jgi:hypothetical protein
MLAPEITHGMPHGENPPDPGDLLIDQLGQALARACTHGTMVSLVLVPGNDAAAEVLRETLHEDHTVARYEADLVAVIAEHPYGDAKPIVDRIRDVVHARAGWYTDNGTALVHEMIFRAEVALI